MTHIHSRTHIDWRNIFMILGLACITALFWSALTYAATLAGLPDWAVPAVFAVSFVASLWTLALCRMGR